MDDSSRLEIGRILREVEELKRSLVELGKTTRHIESTMEDLKGKLGQIEDKMSNTASASRHV